MYACEIWTIKKAEHWNIDAFELWCWRTLWRVPWNARRSNQSILKETSPECSLEGLMLKLKLNTVATWCNELTHLKKPWCWERLKVGGEGDNRGWDDWMASLTQWTWVWVYTRSWWWTGRPRVLQPWDRKGLNTTEQVHNWTEFTLTLEYLSPWSFPGVCSGKELACQCRRLRRFKFNLRSGWSPGGECDNPLQYYCLENTMDRGTWWTTVYGSQKVRHDWSDLACMHTPLTSYWKISFLNM